MTNLLTNNWSSSFANLWILFCCPDKETTDVGSSTPGVVVHWLIVKVLGRESINCVDQTTRPLHRQRMCRAEHVSTDMPGITQSRGFFGATGVQFFHIKRNWRICCVENLRDIVFVNLREERKKKFILFTTRTFFIRDGVTAKSL